MELWREAAYDSDGIGTTCGAVCTRATKYGKIVKPTVRDLHILGMFICSCLSSSTSSSSSSSFPRRAAADRDRVFGRDAAARRGGRGRNVNVLTGIGGAGALPAQVAPYCAGFFLTVVVAKHRRHLSPSPAAYDRTQRPPWGMLVGVMGGAYLRGRLMPVLSLTLSRWTMKSRPHKVSHSYFID